MAAACARSQTRKKKLECNRPWCRAVHSTLSVPGCCAACGVCACLRCAFAAFFVGANHPTDCRYNTSTVPTGNECVGRTLPASSPESEEIDPKSVHHGTRQTSHTQRHSTHTRDTRAAASSARRPPNELPFPVARVGSSTQQYRSRSLIHACTRVCDSSHRTLVGR